MFEEDKQKKMLYTTFIICGLVLFLGVGTMSVLILGKDARDNQPLVIEALESTYEDSGHVPMGEAIMSEEEWASSMGTTSYGTYDDYLAAASAFKSSTPTITATGINGELFQYCDQYFKAYYGSTRISPLFPMALSNCETQGRADYSVTYSALIPSKVVDPSRAGTFDVTDVLADEKVFDVLSHEWSTRDRGCLQMSPTYGTNNDYLNSLMSGTEKEKLKNVNTSGHDSWVAGASSTPGDRFYLPDVLMRLQAAVELDVNHFVKNGYLPKSDMQLIAMLGIEHNSGWIFSYSDHNRPVGRWSSGGKALEYCEKLGAIEFVNALTAYAKTSSTMYMSPSKAHSLYQEVYGEGYSSYCSNSTNAAYPIMVMYAYIKLVDAYTE